MLRQCVPEEGRARVHPLVHEHRAHAGFLVAREDRPDNRRRSPVPGKKTRMDIHRAPGAKHREARRPEIARNPPGPGIQDRGCGGATTKSAVTGPRGFPRAGRVASATRPTGSARSCDLSRLRPVRLGNDKRDVSPAAVKALREAPRIRRFRGIQGPLAGRGPLFAHSPFPPPGPFSGAECSGTA